VNGVFFCSFHIKPKNVKKPFLVIVGDPKISFAKTVFVAAMLQTSNPDSLLAMVPPGFEEGSYRDFLAKENVTVINFTQILNEGQTPATLLGYVQEKFQIDLTEDLRNWLTQIDALGKVEDSWTAEGITEAIQKLDWLAEFDMVNIVAMSENEEIQDFYNTIFGTILTSQIALAKAGTEEVTTAGSVTVTKSGGEKGYAFVDVNVSLPIGVINQIVTGIFGENTTTVTAMSNQNVWENQGYTVQVASITEGELTKEFVSNKVYSSLDTGLERNGGNIHRVGNSLNLTGKFDRGLVVSLITKALSQISGVPA
jgi:hypothetical protein